MQVLTKMQVLKKNADIVFRQINIKLMSSRIATMS
jgi:hypothetical protein